MFDSWNAWTWVVVAWAEVVLAYGGYLYYLNRRARQLEEREDEPSDG